MGRDEVKRSITENAFWIFSLQLVILAHTLDLC